MTHSFIQLSLWMKVRVIQTGKNPSISIVSINRSYHIKVERNWFATVQRYSSTTVLLLLLLFLSQNQVRFSFLHTSWTGRNQHKSISPTILNSTPNSTLKDWKLSEIFASEDFTLLCLMTTALKDLTQKAARHWVINLILCTLSCVPVALYLSPGHSNKNLQLQFSNIYHHTKLEQNRSIIVWMHACINFFFYASSKVDFPWFY